MAQIKTIYSDLVELIAWHSEQATELEGEAGHENELQFHRDAVATLERILGK